MDINSKQSLQDHYKKIRQKGILNSLYKEFYKEILSGLPTGKIVELGSGGGFIKEIEPNVLTSDVIAGRAIDKVFSATKIPFKNNSIAAFIMLDTFHHIKNTQKALNEMQRCLKKGGEIVMIEPFNSWWGRFIYKNFHYEGFDEKAGWTIKGSGRLSDANNALPWIVFIRDRLLFEKKFPMLKIISITPHTPFCYLLSGTLSYPQLLPSFLYGVIRSFERLILPFGNVLSMFATIRIQKK